MRNAWLAFSVVVSLSSCGGTSKPVRFFDCKTEDCQSCTVLAANLGWSTTSAELALCTTCQGKPQGTTGCSDVPLVSGKYVIRGCDVDSDCAQVTSFCATHTGFPHYTCTTSDAL